MDMRACAVFVVDKFIFAVELFNTGVVKFKQCSNRKHASRIPKIATHHLYLFWFMVL